MPKPSNTDKIGQGAPGEEEKGSQAVGSGAETLGAISIVQRGNLKAL